MRDDLEDDDDRPDVPTQFPGVVRAAGIIWIIIGCIILFNAVINLALSGANAANQDGSARPGGTCGVIFTVLFGAVFIHVGVQSIRGTAKDTLGNAIGSIVFALLYGGVGAVIIIGGLAFASMAGAQKGAVSIIAIVIGGIALLSAMGLLAAGVMALMGRQQYKAWRAAEKRNQLRDEDR